MEFQNVLRDDQWRWSARKIADNKFSMRFPNAKIIQDYSMFRLGVKNSETQMIIEPWTSSLWAKGQLQQAWFKVKGIPVDQRSIRTIANLGGLVGKTMAIDENKRYKTEFVRIKIACRDIYVVPASAEGNLGLHIYDFFYELEEPDNMKRAAQKSSVEVTGDGKQPTPKKMRMDTHPGSSAAAKEKDLTDSEVQINKSTNQSYDKGAFSAPGKLDLRKSKTQNLLEVQAGDETIPAATYQPSPEGDVESDSSADFEGDVEKVMNYGTNNDAPMRGAWMVQHDIVHAEKPNVEDVLDFNMMLNPCEKMKELREERRWSKRIQNQAEDGVISKMMDVNPTTGKKRPLEGNNILTSNSFSILDNNDIISRVINMGVPIADSDFDSINLLRDLEQARLSLNRKNVCNIEPVVEDTSLHNHVNENNDDSVSDLVEWNDVASNASDDFILVTPKRNRRPPNKLILSVPKKKKRISKTKT